jgi:hypothetical protein
VGQHIVNRIASAHSALYRRSDLAAGGIHGGIFMFRDVFARIDIPMAYGKVAIEPLTLTDLSDIQIRWLCSRPADLQMFLDQFTDIFDFAGSFATFGDYKRPSKEALEVFWLAAFQLHVFLRGYASAFAQNDVDFTVLAQLTDVDLRELGVTSLGHRKRLLAAIAARETTAPSIARPTASRPSGEAASGHHPLCRSLRIYRTISIARPGRAARSGGPLHQAGRWPHR